MRGEGRERRALVVRGVVQGVGFRPWIFGLATRLGLAGHVRNRAGEVEIEVEGERGALERFVASLRDAPAPARVESMAWWGTPPSAQEGFRIAASEREGVPAGVPADLPVCADCLAECRAPGRRHGYALVSCACCGPRFTIVRALPYDRERTALAAYPLCADCRREYEDPGDRRFHAETMACPVCGPRVWIEGARGEPIAAAAQLLRHHGIVAVKGLGGWHLACDATDEAAVLELRRRKRRDGKPFAVLVDTLQAAEAIAALADAHRELLGSAARPIVLCPRRVDSPLAPSIAPGLHEIGVMLAYTPMHHLLAAAVGRPLVMTSGNESGESIVFRDGEARARLAGLADALLGHDRPIERPADDSLVRVVDGAPMVLRRARGFAPTAFQLPNRLARPSLAAGGQGKAVFAFGDGRRVVASQHLGDLDEAESLDTYVAMVEAWKQLFAARPERLVVDRHPDYASTRFARAWAAREGLEVAGVGHHHAHFAACLAEHDLREPAIGVCFDGAGLGDDGTLWGGELLLGDAAEVCRVARLQPVALPGGDAAAREPWRMAVAYLVAAGVEPTTSFLAAHVSPERLAAVSVLARRGGAHAPPVSSAGRLFDAVAALIGLPGSDRQRHEADVAMRLESLARTGRGPAYPFEIHTVGEREELSFLPMIHALLHDRRAGVAPDDLAARFHAGLAEGVAELCRRIAARTGTPRVALSGGCFANAVLSERLIERLPGMEVLRHRQLPPGDGGLAFGQLAVLAARDAREVA